MTAKPSIWTRIRHAIFGAPLSHEQAQAKQQAGSGSHRNGAQSDAVNRSVQNQTWI